MIHEHNGKAPVIAQNVFIAPNAVIIGDVTIDEYSSIWYGAVVRGDLAAIRIGKNTNIQDNVTVHTDTEKPVIIGDWVTIGHNAVVHGCTLEDHCLIGMSAVILNASVVKTGSVVAAGSIVKEKQIVGPYQLVAGSPAILKRKLAEDIISMIDSAAKDYLKLSNEHARIHYPVL